MRNLNKSLRLIPSMVVLLGLSLPGVASAVLPGWVCSAASQGANAFVRALEDDVQVTRARARQELTRIFLDYEYSDASSASAHLLAHFEEHEVLLLKKSDLNQLMRQMDQYSENPNTPEYEFTASRKTLLLGGTLMALTLEMGTGNPEIVKIAWTVRGLIAGLTALALGKEVFVEFKNWVAEIRHFGRKRSPSFLHRFLVNQFPRPVELESASQVWWKKLVYPMLAEDGLGPVYSEQGRFYIFKAISQVDDEMGYLIAVPRLKNPQ
jgi:hypothetical protein